ncbi:UbiX family flavin prenyltransferase [Vibrio sp. CAIM 722]|uniref:Flavin prenyltransferase UbiX n=1 Tax=Vibrio eleionomae TaxID=2653505 RepID=A0A7X4LKS1_9VIBR|nr:UbiX family flavin prenyltransferase [Vibrio eleionomae]MZI93447.1 UbiX family flavin prenyltransferase [Vibrio eleionomae]
MTTRRIVVGVSGASGVPLAFNLLKELRNHSEIETHLVVSGGTERTIEMETDYDLLELHCLADVLHDNENIGASIASGTFRVDGMIVVPCSMKTLAGIAHGYSDNLLLRAADVNIKERRKLVLVTRETPLSRLHLKNMLTATEYGAIIMPPMLTYYNHPETIEDMETHIVGKILHEFDIEATHYKRWCEDK